MSVTITLRTQGVWMRKRDVEGGGRRWLHMEGVEERKGRRLREEEGGGREEMEGGGVLSEGRASAIREHVQLIAREIEHLQRCQLSKLWSKIGDRIASQVSEGEKKERRRGKRREKRGEKTENHAKKREGQFIKGSGKKRRERRNKRRRG